MADNNTQVSSDNEDQRQPLAGVVAPTSGLDANASASVDQANAIPSAPPSTANAALTPSAPIMNAPVGVGETPTLPSTGVATAPGYTMTPASVDQKANTTVEGKQLSAAEQALLQQKDQQTAAALQTQGKLNDIATAKAGLAQQQAVQEQRITQSINDAKSQVVQAGQDVMKQKLAEYQTQYDAFKQMGFHSYWQDKGTGTQILAAMSVGLGALGSSLTHAPNTAADIINNAVNRDFNTQKARIEQQQAIVGMAHQGIDVARNAQADALSALDVKKAAALDSIAAKYKTLMAQQGYSEAQINGDVNLQKLQQAATDAKLAVYARTEQNVKSSVDTAVNSIAVGAPGTVGAGLKVGTVPTPEQVKANEKAAALLKTSANLKNPDGSEKQMTPEGMAALNDWEKYSNLGHGLGEAYQAAQAYRGINETNILRSDQDKEIKANQDIWLQQNLGEEGIGGRRLSQQDIADNRQRYFPTVGDTPQSIAAKAQARAAIEQQVIKGNPAAAGNAAPAVQQAPKAPEAPKAPAPLPPLEDLLKEKARRQKGK